MNNLEKYASLTIGVGVSLAVVAALTFAPPARDVAADAIAGEDARVVALLAQDWNKVRELAHPEFQHFESNGQFRTIDQFVAAMKWCGENGKTPGKPEDMPKGGGFSFETHDIDKKSRQVFVMPNGEDALVTGKYSKILRRCYVKPDGTTGVETPTAAKPATFVRFYENGLLRYHRALVDTSAPAASMSVNFPPPPK